MAVLVGKFAKLFGAGEAAPRGEDLLKPFFYFKPVFVCEDGAHWSRGENFLAKFSACSTK